MKGLKFDTTGLVIPQFSELYQSYIENMKNIFGNDIYLEDDSPDGQLISFIALSQYEILQAVQAIWLSWYPSSAQGANLDRVCSYQGIQRKQATKSTCSVTLTAVIGTVINNGVVVDVNNELWTLPATVTITSETTDVIVTSVNNAVYVGSNEIVNILTTVEGWQSVTNKLPCIQGNKNELDSELRIRRAKSVLSPSIAPVDGLYGALLSVGGVSKVKVYENQASSISAIGLPPNSVTCVVLGGQPMEIADTIYMRKTMGCYVAGDQVINITDIQGNTHIMRFYLPVFTQIQFSIQLEKLDGYSDDLRKYISDGLIAYISSLQIGDDIYYGSIINVIYSSNPNKTVNYNITALQMSKFVDNEFISYTSRIPIEYKELATLTKENVIFI